MNYREIQCQCQVEHFTAIAKDTVKRRNGNFQKAVQDISGY